MALEKYSIGGTVQETESSEAFADISGTRAVIAEKLTAEAPIRPEIVEGLTNEKQVFDHFQPKINVDLETEEGTLRQETFSFKGLEDFGIKGITAQSSLLNELTLKKDQYQKIIRQLKTNKLLRQALADKKSKENLIAALSALIMELEEAK